MFLVCSRTKRHFMEFFFLSKKSENRCSSLAAESRKKSRCNQPATLWTILLAQVTTLPLCVIFCCQRKRPYLIIMIINFFVVDNNKKIGRAEWNKNYTRRALGFFIFFFLTWGTLKSHQLVGCDFYDDRRCAGIFLSIFLCQIIATKFIFLTCIFG